MKLLLILLCLSGGGLLFAQPYLYQLEIEHQYNRLSQALKELPGDRSLLLGKVLLLQNELDFYGSDTIKEKFNYQKYSLQAQIQDLNYILQSTQDIVYQNDTFDLITVISLRANLFLQLRDTISAEKDFQFIYNAFQKNYPVKYKGALPALIQIVIFYEELADYAKALEDKKLYTQHLTKALQYLESITPIERTDKFSIKDTLLIEEISFRGASKIQLLSELMLKDKLMNYYKKLLRHTYEYTLTLEQDAQDTWTLFSIDEYYYRMLNYAYELAQLYYDKQDYKNSKLWLQAYLQDAEQVYASKKSAFYDLFLTDGIYNKAYKLMYQLAMQEKSKDKNLAIHYLQKVIGEPIAQQEIQDSAYLAQQLEYWLQKESKSGELYYTYATFKFKNRTAHYYDYATYGKELLALLDKAEALQEKNPQIDLMRGIIYKEFEDNENLADFYIQKAIQSQPNLKFAPILMFMSDNFDEHWENMLFSDELDDSQLAKPIEPKAIIQLLYK